VELKAVHKGPAGIGLGATATPFYHLPLACGVTGEVLTDKDYSSG
jgi:hypothetical protein